MTNKHKFSDSMPKTTSLNSFHIISKQTMGWARGEGIKIKRGNKHTMMGWARGEGIKIKRGNKQVKLI